MYKCHQSQHDQCSNSALCHLCDGVKLYHNEAEIQMKKAEEKVKRTKENKNSLLKIFQKEKEGIGLEKDVVERWNQSNKTKKRKPVKKPRLSIENDIEEEVIESSVLSSYAPIKSDAVRQKNSGALWYAKGDVKTEDYLMECKERSTVNARGEKTISISKEWLIKQEKEAFMENRHYWLLPFRYKNDDTIYVVKPLDLEIEMYQELKRMREELATIKLTLQPES